MKILIAVAAAAALGPIAAPASAEQVRFEVEYADLNLQSAEGQKVLGRRIQQAARKACGYGKTKTDSRIRSREARECVAEMSAKAQRQFAAITRNAAKGG